MNNQIKKLQSDTYIDVINDLVEREQMGISKYGVTVDQAQLSELEWMQHAYEEALDFAIYLKRMMKLKSNQ